MSEFEIDYAKTQIQNIMLLNYDDSQLDLTKLIMNKNADNQLLCITRLI